MELGTGIVVRTLLGASGPALAVAGAIFTQYGEANVSVWHWAPLSYVAIVFLGVFSVGVIGLGMLRSRHPLVKGIGLCVSAGLVLLVADALGARVLLAEVQSRAVRMAWMAAAFAVLVGSLWMIREAIARIFFAGGSAVLAAGVVSAIASGAGERDAPFQDGNASLPPVIYIIADAAAGVNGIDESVPSGSDLRDSIDEFAARYGFRSYPSAFSRHVQTARSVPATLSFDWNSSDPRLLSSVAPTERYAIVQTMLDRGYATSIYQTGHIDFCGDDVAVRCRELRSFDASSVHLPDDLRFAAVVALMTGARQDSLLFYNVNRFLARLLPTVPPPSLDSFMYLSWFDEIRADIRRGGRGQFYLIHLLMPHEPYVYGPSCGYESWTQEEYRDFGGRHAALFAAEREGYLSRYYDQYICAVRTFADLLDDIERDDDLRDATVVFQGDHGSRISSGFGSADRRDMIDNFSALYMIRSPDISSGIDGEQVSVQRLTAEYFGNADPNGRSADEATVFLQVGADEVERRDMPRLEQR